MKNYNSKIFSLYKAELRKAQPVTKPWDEYSREELIIKFLPLVENLASKFPLKDAAIGIQNRQDLISHGFFGLIKAVNKIDMKTIMQSADPEKTIKSFFSKRIKGAIRRDIDKHRAPMRIPEHKLNELRKGFDDDPDKQAMYYNSMYSSIDEPVQQDFFMQIEDGSDDPMRKDVLYVALMDEMANILSKDEYTVLTLSFGIGRPKIQAKDIALELGIQGASSYVRISQIKKRAIEKLRENINEDRFLDLL